MQPATDESAHQLRRLEVLADPDLAQLGTTELVNAVLVRVEETLGVDTVAVLVVDRGGSQLVARRRGVSRTRSVKGSVCRLGGGSRAASR